MLDSKSVGPARVRQQSEKTAVNRGGVVMGFLKMIETHVPQHWGQARLEDARARTKGAFATNIKGPPGQC